MNKKVVAFLAIIGLFVLMLGAILAAQWPSSSIQTISNQVFGTTMFTTYGFTFIVVGLVMFVSMMGGVFLAQEEDNQ